MPAARGQMVDWLYDVDITIPDRSVEARASAASDALRSVLVRVTGSSAIPPSPAVDAALRNPDRYYVRYGFAEETIDGATVTKLRVRFAESAILRLVAEADLPLWSANRPVLMVWAAVDRIDATENPDDPVPYGGLDAPIEILTAESAHPLARALETRARERGLPLVLPAMDLEDATAAPLDAVVGADTLVLREAAERYRADGIVGLRVQGGAQGPWSMRGRILMLDQERDMQGGAATPEELARTTLDSVVDMLAARYAVVAGEDGRLDLRIDGVSDVAQYAAVMRYLERLEFIDRVQVVRVERHSLHLSVFTRTPWGQLKDLFDLEGRLVALSSAAFDLGDEIPLLWRDDAR